MRYTALAGGLFYGISHNQALKSAGRAAQEKHEYEAQENKISEAKRAWEERQKPASSGESFISFMRGRMVEWVAVPGLKTTQIAENAWTAGAG